MWFCFCDQRIALFDRSRFLRWHLLAACLERHTQCPAQLVVSTLAHLEHPDRDYQQQDYRDPDPPLRPPMEHEAHHDARDHCYKEREHHRCPHGA